METSLGRVLQPREHIHHIDGNKSNNNIENLQLFPNASSHSKIHPPVWLF